MSAFAVCPLYGASNELVVVRVGSVIRSSRIAHLAGCRYPGDGVRQRSSSGRKLPEPEIAHWAGLGFIAIEEDIGAPLMPLRYMFILK